MSLVPKVMYRVITFLIKIPYSHFFGRNWQAVSKFIWKYKGSRITKTTLTNSKVRALSDFKIYKATVFKTL